LQEGAETATLRADILGGFPVGKIMEPYTKCTEHGTEELSTKVGRHFLPVVRDECDADRYRGIQLSVTA
jgi:hypothetical protein